MSSVRSKIAAVVIALFTLLAASASASALTLGTTTQPSGSSFGTCGGFTGITDVLQTGTEAAYSYTVPSGGGYITSWSFNTSGATAGTPYGLIVARPTGSGYTVVGSDNELVPASLPAVASFTLSTPLQVQAGDVIGIVMTNSGTSVHCVWDNGPLTTADTLATATGTPNGNQATGAPLTTSTNSYTKYVTNVSVNLVQSQDLAVTQTAGPGSLTVGGTGLFVLSVTDSGQTVSPITLTDIVPTGLTIDSVSAGSGACATLGQEITCTGLTAPASITVAVTGSRVGVFANAATVTSALPDPNSANNSSSETLDVGAQIATMHWVSVAKLPLAEAKFVIRDLGCGIGRITKKRSKTVKKGDVISTNAVAGQPVVVGATITIVESSGKPVAKKKKKK